MITYIKKIIVKIPGSLLISLITIIFLLIEKIKIKNISKKNKLKLFDSNDFKKNSNRPFFILGSGTSVNDLTAEEKKFINNSTSVGLNFFFLSDLYPKYLFWEHNQLGLDMLKFYSKTLKNKKLNTSKYRPSIILYHGILNEVNDIRKFNKYFNSISIYNIARIFYLKINKLKGMYNYLFHSSVLKLSNHGMIYGLHSSVDRIMFLALASGYQEIIFVGVDLKDSKNFWDKLKFNQNIKKELNLLKSKNSKEVHIVEKKIANYNNINFQIKKSAIEKTPLSEIIKITNEHFSVKGIKFYTYSKKSKLSKFLPTYKFPIQKKTY